jgi:hypothetical protein
VISVPALYNATTYLPGGDIEYLCLSPKHYLRRRRRTELFEPCVFNSDNGCNRLQMLGKKPSENERIPFEARGYLGAIVIGKGTLQRREPCRRPVPGNRGHAVPQAATERADVIDDQNPTWIFSPVPTGPSIHNVSQLPSSCLSESEGGRMVGYRQYLCQSTSSEVAESPASDASTAPDQNYWQQFDSMLEQAHNRQRPTI